MSSLLIDSQNRPENPTGQLHEPIELQTPLLKHGFGLHGFLGVVVATVVASIV